VSASKSPRAVQLEEAPIFSASGAMRRVLDEVTRASQTSAHVIISGEAGTGREFVAREIHRRAGAPERPFVKVPSVSESPDNLEREIFGCPRGQMADRQERRTLELIGRDGHLYEALGGTIFLSNLKELPADIQIRLTRLLSDGEALVMPAKTRTPVTVRAIAAVEQGYDQRIRDGRIHEPLYRLLSAVRIELPPLRNRSEDIPALAAFLLDKSCRQGGIPSKQLSSAAEQLLSALPWHGNAVELKRLLTEIVQRVSGDIIDLTDVLATVQIDGRAKPLARAGTLREARARFEREYIATVMAQHHGRIPEAAKTLGVQRPNLYRKLRQLNVPKTSRSRSAGR
jgi:DNA-binding NtrC family response regulator